MVARDSLEGVRSPSRGGNAGATAARAARTLRCLAVSNGEERTPEHFFTLPDNERTKQFLSKIL